MISAGQTMAVRTIEPAAMAVLFPRVSGNKKRGFFIWMSVLTAFLEIVFSSFFRLGDYAMTQLFPIHSIAVLSEFSVFQRIDVTSRGCGYSFCFYQNQLYALFVVIYSKPFILGEI